MTIRATMTDVSKTLGLLLTVVLAVVCPAFGAETNAPAARSPAKTANHKPASPARTVEVGDLVCEWFGHNTSYCSPVRLLSGWEVEPGGKVHELSFFNTFKLIAADGRNPTTIRRRFVKVRDGMVTWEFKFHLPKMSDGPAFSLQDGTSPMLTLAVKDGKLAVLAPDTQTTVLADVRPNEDCGILVVIDLDARRALLRINGRNHSAPLPLTGKKEAALDHIEITTGKGFTGELFVCPVLVYRGYALRERFITTSVGALPDGWTAETAGGSVSVQRAGGGMHAQDQNALRLEKKQNGSVAAMTTFAPLPGAVEIECKVLNSEALEGVRFEVRDADKRVVAAIETRDGGLVSVDADKHSHVLWKGCRTTVWYDLRIVTDPAAKLAQFFVNNIAVATNIKVSESRGGIASLRVAMPEAGTGALWADDFVVRRHLPYPDDYVPEPRPVSTGQTLVGMQSCDLWREGFHLGWDWIRPHAERKPLLGWYNGGDPEVEDWAIKWMCENGIAFDFKCWYRSGNNERGRETGRPIHSTMEGEGLDGFKRARWSGKLRFAINLTNHFDMFAGLDDWKRNVVPYLIEHLFRDPRYMVCNNNPVNFRDPLGLCADYQSAIDAVKQNYDFGNRLFNFLAGLMLDWVGQSRQTQLDAQASGLSPGTAYTLGAVQAGAGGAFASATIGLTGIASGELLGSASVLIPVAGAAAGPILQRGNGVLVAITPNGQVLTGNLGTSHAAFAQRVGVAAANGQLVSGAYVGTAFNSGGQIAVLNSMTFFGNQAAANPAVQTAVRAAIGAQ